MTENICGFARMTKCQNINIITTHCFIHIDAIYLRKLLSIFCQFWTLGSKWFSLSKFDKSNEDFWKFIEINGGRPLYTFDAYRCKVSI